MNDALCQWGGVVCGKEAETEYARQATAHTFLSGIVYLIQSYALGELGKGCSWS